MNTKRTTFRILFVSALAVLATVGLSGTFAMASNDRGPKDLPTVRAAQTDGENMTACIIHESADILCYDNGAPYIHDILTNDTDRTVLETQYCMLAYDENGSPLKLHWNFLDSSAKSSFEYVVRSEERILSGQTEEYRGGWSLYDGESMEEFPDAEHGGANEAAYALLCLEQVVFDDGTVWENPDYEDWLETYAGKEIPVDVLENYYPHEYRIDTGESQTAALGQE